MIIVVPEFVFFYFLAMSSSRTNNNEGTAYRYQTDRYSRGHQTQIQDPKIRSYCPEPKEETQSDVAAEKKNACTVGTHEEFDKKSGET